MTEQGCQEEIAFAHGNSTVVHRVGETVRRVTGPHSPAVHALLIYLERAGCEYAPRFLGIDDRGREVLTYLEGTVGNYPMPAEVRSREAMETAVVILRRLHDLTAGVRLPEGDANPLRPETGSEVICHGDAAPYNYVFEGTRAVGLIDFDNAGPGRRIDDLAYFAYRFAPLCSDDTFPDGGWSAGIDRFGRLARIFELYPDDRATELPDLIIGRLEAMKKSILMRVAAAGAGVPSRAIKEHVGIYTRDQTFVDAHRGAIADAVR
ncbi:aminoglycoside phosphotransferase family protein [Frankia tisae]|uniref:aminoglycoside phosphotransferase family protein n=1 Tax=Frankia tisae TaxID=2950104 RepID=UPI0021BF4395|nr:aminoglycoside phosphotransferase family protein [Frankia tisae]